MISRFDPDTGEVILPYEGWCPYCAACDARRRMTSTGFGWKCLACKNEIDRKLQRREPGLP
jgi:tRNA(Ile2) C34 agmatinyltransferase TiaS